MNKIKSKFEALVTKGERYIMDCSENSLSHKPSPAKWSKKEILGHLIDSGINNLQRFTEIQFENKPFPIRRYNQNQLVIANDYQHADARHLLSFWLAINHRIMHVMDLQTPNTLAYEITLPDGSSSDLKFLMEDYVAHLEHHLDQIMSS